MEALKGGFISLVFEFELRIISKAVTLNVVFLLAITKVALVQGEKDGT